MRDVKVTKADRWYFQALNIKAQGIFKVEFDNAYIHTVAKEFGDEMTKFLETKGLIVEDK